MRRPATLLVLATAVTVALSVGFSFLATTSAFAWANHALFVQTGGSAANQIVVYNRTLGGTLHLAATYVTGGKGRVDGPLASQGSLVCADQQRVLLAVNAGSDTVSVFRIVRGNRLKLRQVIGSGGTFPVGIAVHGNLVYVLNAGGAGTLRGYRLSGAHLRRIVASNRSLGLANGNWPNPLSSPGQVGFAPNGRRLIVTTRGSGSDLLVFLVGRRGRLSAHPVVNAAATPSPFAFTFDSFGRMVVTETAMSTVSTYSINANNSLTTLGSAPDGQTAAGWITAALGHFYVSNSGSANISAFTLNSSGQPVLVGVAATTEAGPIDSVTTPNQRYLYVECGEAGTIDAFRINNDGTLTLVETATALPVPLEGIAVD